MGIEDSVGEGAFGEGAFGDGAFGDGAFGEGAFGEGAFGEGAFGEGAFGDGAFGDGAFGEGAFGDGAFGGGLSLESWFSKVRSSHAALASRASSSSSISTTPSAVRLMQLRNSDNCEKSPSPFFCFFRVAVRCFFAAATAAVASATNRLLSAALTFNDAFKSRRRSAHRFFVIGTP